MALAEVEVIKSYALRSMLVGSRVTCNPPVVGTDQDVLVLVKYIEASIAVQMFSAEAVAVLGEVDAMHRDLRHNGWVLGGSGDHDDDFESWTNGDVNLILVADVDFYNLFVCATALCKKLNIMGKEDRKLVFRSVLYKEHSMYLDERGNEECF